MSDSTKAVFLSYASQDAAAARRICEMLRDTGVEVWFDQSELRGGDAWDQKIRRQIRECALFVPIISANTQARPEGYFRLEWRLAADRSQLIARDYPFVVPVILDDTPNLTARAPEEFQAVQWMRLTAASELAAFCARIAALLAVPAGAPQSPNARGAGERPRREEARTMTAGAQRQQRWYMVLAAILLVALAALIGWKPWKDVPSSGAIPVPMAGGPRVGVKSIAVLPFANMSDNKDATAFFSDGVHDDILSNLAVIRELRVISRTTVMQYRDTTKLLREIGEDLGVAYILEGTVRRTENHVRVTAQLIDARSDEHIWAKQFNRELRDIFAIQAKLAEEIATSLRAVISPGEQQQLVRRPTEDVAAYDLYLKERAIKYGAAGDPEKRATREAYLQAAVRLDPKFADAWAALGHFLVSNYLSDGNADTLRKADAAIAEAVNLAPDNGQILVTQADRAMEVEHDYPRAAEFLDRAERLQPNNFAVHGQKAELRIREARYGEAMLHYRRCLELDPHNVRQTQRFVELLDAGRRYDDMLIEQRRVVRLNPGDIREAFLLAWIPYRASGLGDEARQFMAHSLEASTPALTARIKRVGVALMGLRADATPWADNIAGGTRGVFRTNRNASSFLVGQGDAVMVLAASGRLHEARQKLDLAAQRERVTAKPHQSDLWMALAESEVLDGNAANALQAANKAIELVKNDARMSAIAQATLTFVHAWSGEKDVAVSEYERLVRVPFSRLNIYEMKHDPRHAPLRGNANFEALLNDPKNNRPLF
jgi:TolB-like protein/cytochrome c-type biogenesis protein CcmH/NrfG